MLLQNHFQGIEARPEDCDGQGPEHRPPRLAGRNVVKRRDEVPGDVEELLLVESGIHQVQEHLQGPVQRPRGATAIVDYAEKRRQEVRPLFREIGAGNLADGETGRRLDLALGGLGHGGQVQEDPPDLILVDIADEDVPLELVQIRGPGGGNKGAQDGEGGLTEVGGDGVVRGNGGEREGEALVGVETQQLKLGGLSRIGDRRLRVGKERQELLLHSWSCVGGGRRER